MVGQGPPGMGGSAREAAVVGVRAGVSRPNGLCRMSQREGNSPGPVWREIERGEATEGGGVEKDKGKEEQEEGTERRSRRIKNVILKKEILANGMLMGGRLGRLSEGGAGKGEVVRFSVLFYVCSVCVPVFEWTRVGRRFSSE